MMYSTTTSISLKWKLLLLNLLCAVFSTVHASGENPYTKGDKVSVYSRSKKKWYDDGVVVEVAANGKTRVGYDRDANEGDATKKWIPLHALRKMVKPRAEREKPHGHGCDSRPINELARSARHAEPVRQNLPAHAMVKQGDYVSVYNKNNTEEKLYDGVVVVVERMKISGDVQVYVVDKTTNAHSTSITANYANWEPLDLVKRYFTPLEDCDIDLKYLASLQVHIDDNRKPFVGANIKLYNYDPKIIEIVIYFSYTRVPSSRSFQAHTKKNGM